MSSAQCAFAFRASTLIRIFEPGVPPIRERNPLHLAAQSGRSVIGYIFPHLDQGRQRREIYRPPLVPDIPNPYC